MKNLRLRDGDAVGVLERETLNPTTGATPTDRLRQGHIDPQLAFRDLRRPSGGWNRPPLPGVGSEGRRGC